MALPEGFDAEVYSVVAQIPAGRVTTYGQIARLIGMPGYARRVGHAQAEPHPIGRSNVRCSRRKVSASEKTAASI